MTGSDLFTIRTRLGLNYVEMARVLGFEGSAVNERRRIVRLEHAKELPTDMIDDLGVLSRYILVKVGAL